MIQRRADAVNSGRWDTTAGNLGEIDQILGTVYDKEWRRILSANPYYQTFKGQNLTLQSDNSILLSSLDPGSSGRFYRLIGVINNNTVYVKGNAEDYLRSPTLTYGPYVWFQSGTKLYLLPPPTANPAFQNQDGVVFNWIPQRIQDLASDATTVSFPDGYEEILALETAAFLLAKGGAETNTTGEFRALAGSLREEMLADIQRISIDPIRMKYADDSASDWAG